MVTDRCAQGSVARLGPSHRRHTPTGIPGHAESTRQRKEAPCQSSESRGPSGADPLRPGASIGVAMHNNAIAMAEQRKAAAPHATSAPISLAMTPAERAIVAAELAKLSAKV